MEIPLRHNTGDSPAVTCPSGTSQGTVPGIVACAFALLRILLRDGYSMPQKFDFVNSPQRGEFPAHQDDTRGVGHSDDATNFLKNSEKSCISAFSVKTNAGLYAIMVSQTYCCTFGMNKKDHNFCKDNRYIRMLPYFQKNFLFKPTFAPIFVSIYT